MNNTQYTNFLSGWCDECKEYILICPECGNKCCNGTYGEEGNCKICPLTYEIQDLISRFKE